MAFDFPSSPAEGQIFTAPSGPTYVFNTPTWKAVGQGQIAIISDTPPSNPANGALWLESDTGILFIWWNDGNSAQWVQVGGIMGPGVPPSDGGEYVMVNSVWRLSKQNFDLAGLGAAGLEVNFAVPSWANTARLTVWAQFTSSATMNYRVSQDGTTFISGATDYQYGGFVHSTGTNAFTNAPQSQTGSILFAPTSDHASVNQHGVVTLKLVRSGTDLLTWSAKGFGYSSSTATLLCTADYYGWLGAAVVTDRIRAIQWRSGLAATSGKLTVEWLP